MTSHSSEKSFSAAFRSPGSQMKVGAQKIKDAIRAGVVESVESWKECFAEVKRECLPEAKPKRYYYDLLWRTAKSTFYVPYLPAFHRPGWLLRYIVGPFDRMWAEYLIADILAGITVALTLIPQALSYAGLANVPPVNGLYCAILPSFIYLFFGSSMQLAVGPVAIVSLMTGSLVTKYYPNYAKDPVGAVDTAAQASLCAGIIMMGMSMFNMGSFIHFISHPVMSGFTSGAAMSIGLSQVKNAFGFNTPSTIPVPQQGQPGYDYNWEIMEWYAHHWNGIWELKPTDKNYAIQNGKSFINPIAVNLCFGIYVPLMTLGLLKQKFYKPTPERKKRASYYIITIIFSLLPFSGIIIGANLAWRILTQGQYPNEPYYSSAIKIVGNVPAGLNIMRKPTLRHPFGPFFGDCIPITLVLFMESYGVARRIARLNNQLHLLNASQELFSNGLANMLGCVSSAYPVAGSFSRSSLNQVSGAKTPLSKFICLSVVLLALGTLTQTFFYIPQATLSAVIFYSITALIKPGEVWETFKHSKRDALTMVATWVLTFVFDTGIGLAVGIGLSAFFYLADLAFSAKTGPYVFMDSTDSVDGVEIVRLQGDVTFYQAARVKDFITGLILLEGPEDEDNHAPMTTNERIFNVVSKALDKALISKDSITGVEKLPRAIIIDFTSVRLMDTTGMMAMQEVMADGRRKGIKMAISNPSESVLEMMRKYGIYNDSSNESINFSKYLAAHDGLPILGSVDEHDDHDHTQRGSKNSDVELGHVCDARVHVTNEKDHIVQAAVLDEPYSLTSLGGNHGESKDTGLISRDL